MKENKQYRHGDLLIEQVNKVPSGLKKTEDRLLARGEGADHGHFIHGNVDILIAEEDGDVTHYLSTEEEADLRHLLISSGVWTQEHKDIRLPAGNYKVIRQVEYNPYEDAIKRVED